jgi:tetratricopeptide (TPR) repeat protein
MKAAVNRPGRNDPCLCGSGKKYKHCCLPLEPARTPVRSTANDEERGIALLRQGRPGEAAACFKRALARTPGHPVAHNNLGIALLMTGKTQEAIACYRAALAVAPDHVDSHCNLGNALVLEGRTSEAIDCYRRALAIAPDNAAAHYNLGGALIKEGRHDEAVASYRRALAIDPGYVEAHNNLGNTLVLQNKLDEAVDCYQRALSLSPDFAEAHNDLGDTLKQLGRMDEAEKSFRAALALKPAFAEAHNNLGAVLQEQGKLDEAVESIRKALALKPDYYEAHFNLHALLIDPADMGLSIECLKKALALKPDHDEFAFNLGLLLDYSGRSGDAAPYFERISRGSELHRAKLDAWRHIQSAGARIPPMTGSTIQAFELGLAAARPDGLVLEFGVRFGTSVRQIAALAKQPVHGFDSFEGLPETWHHEARGSYTTKGVVPAVPDNVTLHVGWFEDTLPGFLKDHAGPVRFMNVDCDIYSSTRTVLELLAGRIVPGTVIVFDEYIGYREWREDEYRAFQEAVARHGWRYEYLCFSFFTKQVAVRIL